MVFSRSRSEKELNLYVTEPMDYSDMDMDAGNFVIPLTRSQQESRNI